MEIEKSKVLIQFLLIFRQSGDVLFFLYARRLRGYTATAIDKELFFESSVDQITFNFCGNTYSSANERKFSTGKTLKTSVSALHFMDNININSGSFAPLMNRRLTS